MSDLSHVQRTPAEEMKAKSLCYADCSQGSHLDPENGALSICAAVGECTGWVPYLNGARAILAVEPEIESPMLPGLLVEGGDLVV